MTHKLKPSISLTLNLGMSYFNEALNVWEPVIEPVEETRPYINFSLWSRAHF